MSWWIWLDNVCVCVCVCHGVYIDQGALICMYVCMYVCMYKYVCVCVYIYILCTLYTDTHTHRTNSKIWTSGILKKGFIWSPRKVSHLNDRLHPGDSLRKYFVKGITWQTYWNHINIPWHESDGFVLEMTVCRSCICVIQKTFSGAPRREKRWIYLRKWLPMSWVNLHPRNLSVREQNTTGVTVVDTDPGVLTTHEKVREPWPYSYT
jgi:hypothetical protein